ncbi:MAG: hypothetical protein RLN81_16695 [Balneolaceae bacterium]
MIWIIISAIISGLASVWLGYKRLIYLYQVTGRRFLIASLLALSLYSLLLFLFKIEVLSEAVAGAIITNVYASIFGFFTGSAFNQFQYRKENGPVLYCYRSFISEHLPVIIALSLILFGVYRSAVFTDLIVTPIRVSSGLSLLSVGLWGITLRLVPEFRANGIILLDLIIDWDSVLSYRWFGEEVIEIEYTQNDAIRHFKTLVPMDERSEIESLLSKKMREKMEKEDS